VPTHGGIDFELKGIASLLEEATFTVPTYQRSYAWEAVHIDDFWSDLHGSLSREGGGPDYFLGSIVLTRESMSDRLVVIDGQQRLATTSLFLAALREIAAEQQKDDFAREITSQFLTEYDFEEEERVPRLRLNATDDPVFRQLVAAGAAPAGDAKRPESHKRLEDAYNTLRDHLRTDLTAQGAQANSRLAAWLRFLRQDVLVIRLIVPTESEAFLIFETLNARGRDLTIGDLLKNYLFGRAGSRLASVQTDWLESLAALDVSAENELFVNFLRQYWSSRYGLVRERDLYRAIKDRVSTSTDVGDFAAELKKAAGLYSAILNSSDEFWTKFGTSGRDNVDSLLRLDVEQHRPLLLAVMAHFSDTELKKTLRALVSWSVRILILGRLGSGTSEKAYGAAALKVRNGEIKTTEELLKELTAIVPSDAEFQTAFETARVTKPSIARYLLNALERERIGKDEPELVPNKNEEEVNLEHVLPKNAKEADWPTFDPDDVATWVHRMGNLMLLQVGPNGKIGNKAWSVKEPILSASELKLTAMASQYPDWTETEIAERQKELSVLAPTTWPR